MKVTSLNRLAFTATVHCLTGCAIGEVLGMVIGTALNWRNLATVVLSVVLAFFFGYALGESCLIPAAGRERRISGESLADLAGTGACCGT